MSRMDKEKIDVGAKTMNQKQRMMEEAVGAAREAYRKAAKEYLAAVEATPDEMETADEIIMDDCVTQVTSVFSPKMR